MIPTYGYGPVGSLATYGYGPQVIEIIATFGALLRVPFDSFVLTPPKSAIRFIVGEGEPT